MDITSLVNDTYVYIFLAGTVFYFVTLFVFIEKVQDVVKKKKEIHDHQLTKKYDGTVARNQTFIDMFDSLRDNRNRYERLERIVDALHWTGIIYLVGTVLGFILKQVSISQDVAIAIIAAGFLYFFVILIYLVVWYRKNR